MCPPRALAGAICPVATLCFLLGRLCPGLASASLQRLRPKGLPVWFPFPSSPLRVVSPASLWVGCSVCCGFVRSVLPGANPSLSFPSAFHFSITTVPAIFFPRRRCSTFSDQAHSRPPCRPRIGAHEIPAAVVRPSCATLRPGRRTTSSPRKADPNFRPDARPVMTRERELPTLRR